MNVNNSSTVGPNSTATAKVPDRSAKAKDSDVSVSAPEQAVKVPEQEVENIEKAQEVERIASELRKDRLAEESDGAVKEKVENAVKNIRGFIQENQRSLDFDIAHESNRVIISVIDRQTNEVIRQIPPEDAIELSERIERGDDITTSGLLLEGKA